MLSEKMQVREVMQGIKEFKKALKNDPNLKNKFYGIKNEQEAIDIAKQLGFDLDIEDAKEDEDLALDLLEAVAGGKGKVKKYQDVRTSTTVIGDNSTGILKTTINQNL